jgi:hypothetical protein
MKPEVKIFDRENPCTKLDIYNCFRGRRGWLSVQVDVAHSDIGINAPRVMERDGKIVKVKTAKGDFYELTDYGMEWLDKGIRSFLRNHPARVEELQYPLADAPARERRVRS